VVTTLVLLQACSAEDALQQETQLLQIQATQQGNADEGPARDVDDDGLDIQLSRLLDQQNHTADPVEGRQTTDIDSPLAQLGMKLFFSRSLGGEQDVACVSCHHPALGGADDLSLGIGVEAQQPDLLGPGRQHLFSEFTVPRNAPTTFNSGLYRRSLFWDSRIQRLDSGIRTPDSAFGVAADNAGETLLIAQAAFPVTSVEEMRSERFESGQTNQRVRDHLAARIGGFDGGFNAASELADNNWLVEFQAAFGSSEPAESLISYDNIAVALAAYEDSQVFIDSPWKRYVDGDLNAISDDAKHGARLFFTAAEDGGGDCSRCHSGNLFSDEQHHVVAFPQIGHGKGDGPNGDDDFGRERETGDSDDRYKFRTPSLLNVARTAPYGHAGGYATLRDVVRHYDRPDRAADQMRDQDWCNDLKQFADVNDCDGLFPNARDNTRNALRQLDRQPRNESINGINLNNREVDEIVAFLETLTDSCVSDRECLSAWVPARNGGPDGNQLNAVDRDGNPL